MAGESKDKNKILKFAVPIFLIIIIFFIVLIGVIIIELNKCGEPDKAILRTTTERTTIDPTKTGIIKGSTKDTSGAAANSDVDKTFELNVNGIPSFIQKQTVEPEIEISNDSEIIMYVGETRTLKAKTTPDSTDICWSSIQNDEIVSIDEKGIVTALKCGQAKIKAEFIYNNIPHSAECVISVKENDDCIQLRNIQCACEYSHINNKLIINLSGIVKSDYPLKRVDISLLRDQQSPDKRNTRQRKIVIDKCFFDLKDLLPLYFDFVEGEDYRLCISAIDKYGHNKEIEEKIFIPAKKKDVK